MVDLSPGLQWIVAQKNVEIICLFDLLLEDGLKRNLPLKCRCFTDIETVNSQAMSREIAIATAWKRLGKDFPEMAWATVIATVILSPVTVIGNGLVLASILLDPFKNIRRFPVSSLIFSLALADLLVGILVGPLLAYWTIYTYITNSEPFSSTITSFTSAVSIGVSYYSLVALSVDRRIAITTPLQYAYRVTKRRIRNVNVLIWCYFITTETLAIVFDSLSSIFDIILGAHSVIASIILVVLNVTAVRSMSNQALNIKRTVGTENVVAIQNAFNREKAVARTIVIMVVVFQICFLPFLINLFVIYGMEKVTDISDIKIVISVYLCAAFYWVQIH